ncbi:aldose 1-epimerase [Paenibacillus pasadenensis]|uniref:aldose 1-epimerase n=1 Tax=Paenibacillus pasadenensis TaxID=217090 RepID=UPI00203B1D71|nr:aldose 1-epimerase [Paenibacillus pasadenensis]MCM3748762.1 aldose 1-epimerase [Paenibacillus pasadenensis]
MAELSLTGGAGPPNRELMRLFDVSSPDAEKAGNRTTSCEEVAAYGGSALRLQAGGYEALLLPERGGNMISLSYGSLSFLRSPRPDQEAEFAEKPSRYGIPVLFPPNRIGDGRFTAAGRRYQFPVNEAVFNNHIHGLFVRLPWTVLDQGAGRNEAYAEVGQLVDETHPVYGLFPHHFELRIRYTLAAHGLKQRVRIVNHGEKPLPCMLGFHTAFNVPFSPQGNPADYTVKVPLGEHWVTDERMLPTGRMQELDDADRLVASGGASPFAKEWADYYTACPRTAGRVGPVNAMELIDRGLGIKLVYEAGEAYRHWVLWNDSAAGDFICVEPQTCAVNAANLPLPPEETGLLMLEAGDVWEAESRLYAEAWEGGGSVGGRFEE